MRFDVHMQEQDDAMGERSQFDAEVRAFADSIDATALLVVTLGDTEIRSWYFGPGAHAQRMSANGACCAYVAYAKSADAEAECCEKQAADIIGDDENSMRIARSLRCEANRLRRIAEEHRTIAKSIDAAYEEHVE